MDSPSVWCPMLCRLQLPRKKKHAQAMFRIHGRKKDGLTSFGQDQLAVVQGSRQLRTFAPAVEAVAVT